MLIIIVLIFHWYLSLFCQSFFLHRYSSHCMFKMGPIMERFFYFLTFVSQGPSYLNPSAYAEMHRLHHAHSDTDKDPHSPHFHDSLTSLMKKTYEQYMILLDKNFKFESVKDTPKWRLLDSFADSWVTRLSWVALYLFFYLWVSNIWIALICVPIHSLMGPIHGAIVNWCGHKYGYRNFDLNDKSKNTLFFDFLMMGELYQNNHHKRPNDINFAIRWFEKDPIYYLAKIFEKLNIIKIKRAQRC